MNLTSIRTAISKFPESMHETMRAAYAAEAIPDTATALAALVQFGVTEMDPAAASCLRAAATTAVARALSAPISASEGPKRGRPKGSKNKP